MAATVPAVYDGALRSGFALTYTVDATRGGQPVAGATGLRPVGGSITDTTRPGVRRLLNLDLAPRKGLFDLLEPSGTLLTVTARISLTNRDVIDIPMGAFDVDSQRMSESSGRLSLTAPDKWVRIQRAGFLRPQPSSPSATVVSQIVALIRGALGGNEPVNVSATSTERVGTLLWEKDRAAAIMDLAETIGAWVYFDRNGVATVADLPAAEADAHWLIDASASGVLVELDRERSRTGTANIVVVDSSHADGAKFATQYVWDNDPGSPTYAGAGTGSGPTPPDPATAGLFGQVPHYHDTPVLLSAAAATATGATILTRVKGLASQVSLGSVPNPAIDAFDALDVLPAGWRTEVETVRSGGFGTMPFGSGSFGAGTAQTTVRRVPTRPIERHVVDTVSHPLTVDGGAQQIEGRSIGAEEAA